MTSKIYQVGGKKMEERVKMKELINKLIEWLKSKGFSEKEWCRQG